ncbi:hypothetical protein [Marinimicrobium locisalis]|uniref:hypothetical protein n=1 Tax=Marinimicrobium locisalis TaxID=546022 RepID=UPI00322217C5
MKDMCFSDQSSEPQATNDSSLPRQFATAVTAALVGPDEVVRYEAWTRSVSQEAKVFSGFSGIDIVRPRDSHNEEYIVLMKFDTFENLRKWLESSACRKLIARARDLVITRTGFHISYELEPESAPLMDEVKPPAYYKLVVLGILAVYPLVLFTNFILAPILVQLPYLFGVFLSVVVICLLMTYPVMPWLEKLLGPWLHPKRKRVSKLNNS